MGQNALPLAFAVLLSLVGLWFASRDSKAEHLLATKVADKLMQIGYARALIADVEFQAQYQDVFRVAYYTARDELLDEQGYLARAQFLLAEEGVDVSEVSTEAITNLIDRRLEEGAQRVHGDIVHRRWMAETSRPALDS